MYKKVILFPCLLLSVILSLQIPASAGSVLTDGVSILNPRQNIHGTGYEWDNINDVLTLDNLNIQTEDDFGLKIGDNSTVIIKGKNYIKASVAALYIDGDVIFKGNGSLTLYGGEYGVLCNSEKTNKKFSITSGTFDISGGKDALRSSGQMIGLSGGKLKLSAKDGYAINARDLSTSAGVSISANASLFASSSMLLQATDFSIESASPAFICEKSLKLESMKLKVGSSLSSLSDADEYTGENAVNTVSVIDRRIPSILFGDGHTVALDIVLLAVSLTVIAAAIIVPKFIRKKKIEKINSIKQTEKSRKAAK